jgi:hypothetical protein
MVEIAVPMIFLGGMYILSNNTDDNKKKIEREAFRSSSNIRPQNTLPLKNYPVSGVAEMKELVNYYPNANQASDKYFHQSVYEKEAENDNGKYMSLTGKHVNMSDLKHNNMQPFYGSKVKQPNLDRSYESRFDYATGAGSQQFSKESIAPLFKPEKNNDWAHGTPSTTNFIQSRINPSMSMANVKPFEEIRVGPGLNKKNGVNGSNGFNSGLESRDIWRPKTVDELRTVNNPKVNYEGVILGGKRDVTNRGIIGKVEKNTPDTYYINGPERYFTTTGREKGQSARSIQVLPDENRETTTREYFGNGEQTTGEASYVPGSYLPSKRVQLDSKLKHITNGYAPNKHESTEGDNSRQGYKDSVLPNNRSLDSGRQPNYGVVSSIANAVVMPLMDMLRPSRKENFVGNLRPVGNAGTTEINASYVYNPADRPKTTIKEMTEQRKNHQFINNQSESGGYGYTVNPQKVHDQQRDTTTSEYLGNGGNTEGTSNAMVYDYMYNAQLIDKEPISRGRAPGPQGAKMFNGQSSTNIKIDKLDSDRNNTRMYVPENIMKVTPSVELKGKQVLRSEYGHGIQCERNQPEILNAFHSNPYSHSITGVVNNKLSSRDPTIPQNYRAEYN